MNIENEIFKKTHVNLEKLEKYGFQKSNDYYQVSKNFMNDNFRADIIVDKNGKVSGKVFDLQFHDEYTNIRIENNTGEFVNQVREEYKSILEDIKNRCFEKDYFNSEQSNRITKYIMDKYHDEPEFLWEKFSNYGVFRNKNNNKWYAIIMDIDKSKIDHDSGEIEILDIKVEEKQVETLIKKNGFYQGYHMNKKNWITIILDNTVPDSEIFQLIDESYHLVNSKEEWIVPANPKYYDIINCFNDTDTIEWKQSSDIHIGDIVYIYVADPYSSILYKCEAIEVNIPFEYQDKNLSMSHIMKIKLLKRYQKDELSFSKLNELGIKAIRGPRKISKEISKVFE